MKCQKSSDIPISQVEAEGAEGVRIRWLIGKDDGIENFAMRMFELQPGGHTPRHSHRHEHEVFVLEGNGVFFCQGKEHAFESGYVIFVPPQKEHQFRNTGDSTLRFLCLVPAFAC